MAWMPDGAEMMNGNLMPGMATREEIKKLQAAQGKDFDILFLQYMLRHHLGGIHMARAVLDTDPEPEVRSLAETMIKNQSGEVDVDPQHADRTRRRPPPLSPRALLPRVDQGA